MILDLVGSSTGPPWVLRIFTRHLKQYIKLVTLFELVILFERVALLFEHIVRLLFTGCVTYHLIEKRTLSTNPLIVFVN